MNARLPLADIVGVFGGQVGDADEQAVAVAAHAVVNAAHGAAAAGAGLPQEFAVSVWVECVDHALFLSDD